jgi:polyhydroxybutyrate depolymerase
MKRPVVIATVLACFGLPALAVLVDAATHSAANRTTGTIVSSGRERDYILHVPASLDRAKPAALVISLHPGFSTAAFQMNASQWNRVADKHGFIVAYPGGDGGGPRVWGVRGTARYERMPDVVFISELIDKLQAEYRIDPARIYVNGFSNGGGMSFALSCTLSHRIAAVGAVGAAQLLPWAWCRDSTPVPMISFHGTADRFTPYDGGKVFIAENPFPSIPGWTKNWARRNRCAPTPVDSPVAADVQRREYTGCANDASVVLYTIKDGGHTWPGGTELPEWLLGRTTRSIDASEMMWTFFEEHRR